MDLCSLEELVTLQYRIFSALCKWAKQVALRTGHSKQVTGQALRWQLYLDQLGKDLPRWNITQREEWGAIPPGTALPYCLHYAEKGAPMSLAKMLPLPPNCSG